MVLVLVLRTTLITSLAIAEFFFIDGQKYTVRQSEVYCKIVRSMSDGQKYPNPKPNPVPNPNPSQFDKQYLHVNHPYIESSYKTEKIRNKQEDTDCLAYF